MNRRFAWMDALTWSEMELKGGWRTNLPLGHFTQFTGFDSFRSCCFTYRIVHGVDSGMELLVEADGDQVKLEFVPVACKQAA